MVLRMKKALGIILTTLLALCVFAVPAFAYTVHADGTITFEDGSNPTGYKITFDMPQGVTFDEPGGAWGDFIRDAYAVPNASATTTGGYDYYCWADKASMFNFSIPSGYILEDAELVPATAGELVEVDSYGSVMVQLTAPATLKLTLGQVNWDHTYTDASTGVSITLSSVEAKKVEGATFYARELADFDEIGYVQSAVMKAINELPAAQQYSPTGLVAYDTTFSENPNPSFPTAYIGWNQYPFYVTIPLPAGWNTTDIHAYHYWAEPGGGEYAEAVECEWAISNDGKSVIVTQDFGAYYGRYCLVYSGSVSPVHAPGWAQEGNSWYYYEKDGSLRKNNWLVSGGAYYYFGADGKMVAGNFITYSGAYYYFGWDGKLVINNWVPYGGTYFFAGKDGKLVINNWVQYGGKYYFFGKDGKVVVNNWVKYSSYYFYMGANGNPVVNKWEQIGGTWYHFNGSGVCDQVYYG